jgi:hypothetical protein
MSRKCPTGVNPDPASLMGNPIQGQGRDSKGIVAEGVLGDREKHQEGVCSTQRRRVSGYDRDTRGIPIAPTAGCKCDSRSNR